MLNIEGLKDAIKRSGIKKVYIAQQLGISYQGYLRKENGIHDFTSSEVVKMRELLNLSNRQVSEIFLNKK